MTMCVCMRLGRLSRSGRNELRLMHIDGDRLDTMLLPSAAVYIMQEVRLISMSDFGEPKLHARLLEWPQSSGKTVTMCACMCFERLFRSGSSELHLMHIDEDRLDTMLLPSAAVYIMQEVGLISVSDLREAKLTRVRRNAPLAFGAIIELREREPFDTAKNSFSGP
ncbi:hypothetical protein Efla_007006 [Eimeria flavescens]